ncbi:MAG: tandem-95 repeat protein, partial [candidate division Zixibacteria bacterium]|nr:tandem-95 repeat protein [candidate division Zixibacteria bacterium]
EGDELQYRWDFNNDGIWETIWSIDPTATNIWYDDYSGEVSVEVSDGFDSDIDTTQVTINNVAPILSPIPDQSGNEGSAITISTTFMDPGADWHMARVNFEGYFQSASISGNQVSATHTFVQDGTYTVILSVADDDGAETGIYLTVNVSNVAPIVDAGPDQVVNEGDVVSFNPNIFDPGMGDPLTYGWDFDMDDIIDSSLVNPTHLYEEAGIYIVQLMVWDDDEISADNLTVTVNDVNNPPVASNDTVITDEDTSINIELVATDIDGDILEYIIYENPSHGNLSGFGSNLTYTPNLNFNGIDSFTFYANDGSLKSNLGTITINVNSINDAPIAEDNLVIINEDSVALLIIWAIDVDGDTLNYSIVNYPSHGNLSGISPYLIYQPNPNYYGTDSFTFKVDDGIVDSNTAEIDIIINPINDVPVANSDFITTDEDMAVNINLIATDVEGGPLNYSIVDYPLYGTLSGIGPNLIYTPDLGYYGFDCFTFIANDGLNDSMLAFINISIQQGDNNPP